ncbi:15423_t:CDS:2 [Acaulospora morrowiae]|uniref:15423_t:CDS:1 n=1 Tax=Acaulospora morrowiae TaxID=94023 RepID=A0A9N9D5J6_9GLOM|nr:15423_t:CDS:2 [Acaulospora morrowiae]
MQHDLGCIDIEYSHCGTLHWLDERLTNSSRKNPKFGLCCLNGKVVLPLLRDPPPFLRMLFDGEADFCSKFRKNICQYNAAHAFTSLGAKINISILQGHNPYSFYIYRELRHLSEALLSNADQEATYAQLYIYDPNVFLQIKIKSHAFFPFYQQAHKILLQAHEDGTDEDVAIYLHYTNTTDKHCYNLLTINEIAVILPGDGSVPEAIRDIIIRLCEGSLERIHKGHPAYLPLHYVLLFPYGELGWHEGLRHALTDTEEQQLNNQNKHSHLTQMNFYSFRIFLCNTELSMILRDGKLLHEFMVDTWAATEQNRLRYLYMNQDILRADIYQGLADAAENITNGKLMPNNLGCRIILPSIHIGSARHMFEIF